MWKYVSRRVKDTFERSYNVLDVRKTWTCGNQHSTNASCPSSGDYDSSYDSQIKPIENAVDKCIGYWFIRWIKSSKSGSSNDSENENNKYRKRISDGEDRVDNTLLGAITWSGAIVCGWYASQLLCLHRRHLGCDNRGQYIAILNIPNRSLHSNILSHYAFSSPTHPSILTEKTLHEKFYYERPEDHGTKRAIVFEVNNEKFFSETKAKETVHEAVADLAAFLGETEFNIGVQKFQAHNYRSGVTHFKIATGHNHPGATFNLGLCYEKGLGVPRNLKRAMECYQLASSLGHAKAMYNLGVFYAQGLGGLDKDQDAAHKCFVTSAKLGQKEAKDVLESRSTDEATNIDINQNMKSEIFSFSSSIKCI